MLAVILQMLDKGEDVHSGFRPGTVRFVLGIVSLAFIAITTLLLIGLTIVLLFQEL